MRRRKFLKKSEVLREGYIKGLKHAQRIINEMLGDNKVFEIQSWVSYFSTKIDDEEQDFIRREGGFDDDDDAEDCIERHGTPYVDINEYDKGLRINVSEISKIRYDRDKDELTFSCHAGDYYIPDFKSLWTKEPIDGNLIVKHATVIDEYDEVYRDVTVDFSLQ